MIWAFARADQMKEHRFTDDVAIALAFSKQRAIKKFSRYYMDVQPGEVTNVTIRLLKRFPVILTDY
jgi:hypothetical protein